ncbi:hypothetical protein L3N51_01515 [Metallosphaera sp. J1]|uniref:hypothetical protein n=1 Tax=Metallosphaera TaxID=41980 RepID=UPI001EDFE2C2|nr:hypothetical protein [Metallosphaera javensis (ex Hofmann et al. 2022)]MCG3109225.1 hypothetical protein [Metallosphaera javensis (ex Hofmann et al. 2022)]BCS92929.1 MAG: hypothetical protein MjAS7_1537 [Metallosphaera javensis (ex Sakai et al. 2022)]
MDDFRGLIIDIYLSSKIPNYERTIKDGEIRRNRCNQFDGKYCRLVKTKDWILQAWSVGENISPHPILCYLCPYYGSNIEGSVNTSLLQLLREYISIKNGIEREIFNLESKIGEMLYSSLVLKRRRQELINTLNEIESKINIIKVLIRYQDNLDRI